MGLETTRYASGRLADLVSQNETDGYFACGLMAGLQRSGPPLEPLRVGMLWLDEHANCHTPETTRSGSFGGIPVGVATGARFSGCNSMRSSIRRPLTVKWRWGGRLTNPFEQRLLDESMIEQLTVEDLRTASPAVFHQFDRLNAISDRLDVQIDMHALDPREVIGPGSNVPGGPSSEEPARLFEAVFRYPKACAIGFAISRPSTRAACRSLSSTG